MDADAAPDAYISIDHDSFPELVGRFGGEFHLNCVHGATFDAKAACFTRFRGHLDSIIRLIHALVETEYVVGPQESAILHVTIADSLWCFLCILQAVNKS